MVTSMKIDFTD